jgi:hypothetical protein
LRLLDGQSSGDDGLPGATVTDDPFATATADL